ncbi:MAG: ATP-binding cassette domain-containing protein, partial [Acidobacteria bacterium]|nr:ATP-binding cassette domain-containing protein [Acidobacteriota bacterium]
MLQIKDLGKAYRGEWLFRSLDFQINGKDRIGLVGDNGTGKSTLMKMLAGLVQADEGEAIGSKELTFGYLPQEGLFVRGRTLIEETLTVFESLKSMETEIRRLEEDMAENGPDMPEYEKKLERYSLLSQQFQLKEGWSIEAKAGTVLQGLGFSQNDMRRPCDEFSGGWQMRIALAKLLLKQPNLLLLDEPTNHLDLEARNWLEDYLLSYPHAVMLVSHNRYFLDAFVNRIMDIRNRSVQFYAGNYAAFTRQREERMAQLVAAREAQQKEIARLKVFADRFRYKATKAAQVQSRLKELERMELIEIPPDVKPIRLKFPEGPRTGRTVLELSGVSAGYGATPVFRDLNFILEKGERVALVGPNGAGKSTLMKILAGRLPLFSGERKEGHNVMVSYFSQDQEEILSSTKTVWDEVYSVAPGYIVPQLRTMLGCFLFSGDTIEKPVSVLSGGERSRLVLCKLLFSPANCLLLDEPTNHLDIKSKDILMDALGDYGGTLVFVSHDRYFLDGLATKVLEIGNETAVVHPGNYEDYLFKKTEQEKAAAESAVSAAVQSSPAETAAAQTAAPPAEIRKKKVNPYKIKQLTDQIEKLEGQIHLHETRIAVLNQMLASEELYRDHQLFR